VKVYIPGLLASYTRGANNVEAHGATVGELLADLDRQFPGLRFRVINEQDAVRRHIRLFVNAAQVRILSTPLAPGDKVMIVGALSGG
jgi:sulfur-carrier protein